MEAHPTAEPKIAPATGPPTRLPKIPPVAVAIPAPAIAPTPIFLRFFAIAFLISSALAFGSVPNTSFFQLSIPSCHILDIAPMTPCPLSPVSASPKINLFVSAFTDLNVFLRVPKIDSSGLSGSPIILSFKGSKIFVLAL